MAIIPILMASGVWGGGRSYHRNGGFYSSPSPKEPGIDLKPHWEYLKYVLRHKWYVFRAGLKLGGIPFLALLFHDMSKFGLNEWQSYVNYFYKGSGVRDYTGFYSPEAGTLDFNYAWNHHQKRNPHHWQYWVLVNDSDEPQVRCLPMPERYWREMIADWQGAGMAQGKPDTREWYRRNKDKIMLHPFTRTDVERCLSSL